MCLISKTVTTTPSTCSSGSYIDIYILSTGSRSYSSTHKTTETSFELILHSKSEVCALHFTIIVFSCHSILLLHLSDSIIMHVDQVKSKYNSKHNEMISRFIFKEQLSLK